MILNLDKLPIEYVNQVIMDVSYPNKFAGIDTNKENLSQSLFLLGEAHPRRRGFFTKKQTYLLKKIFTYERLLFFYFDLYLSLEGLGLLHSFSVVAPIEKGATNYNPEKLSIWKPR